MFINVKNLLKFFDSISFFFVNVQNEMSSRTQNTQSNESCSTQEIEAIIKKYTTEISSTSIRQSRLYDFYSACMNFTKRLHSEKLSFTKDMTFYFQLTKKNIQNLHNIYTHLQKTFKENEQKQKEYAENRLKLNLTLNRLEAELSRLISQIKISPMSNPPQNELSADSIQLSEEYLSKTLFLSQMKDKTLSISQSLSDFQTQISDIHHQMLQYKKKQFHLESLLNNAKQSSIIENQALS